MKGIILAGGTGSRLFPITATISKQLLPIYDKPLIYYPMSTLIDAGITEILIISSPDMLSQYESHFGDGTHLGLDIWYKAQPEPEGIAQAFILGEEFIGDDDVCLILGDNIFWNCRVGYRKSMTCGAEIILAEVEKPNRYGVAKFSKDGVLDGVIEKPTYYVSNYAMTGIYFFQSGVSAKAKKLKKSARGEYEITELVNEYIRNGHVRAVTLPRGASWMDVGTPKSFADTSVWIAMTEQSQHIKVGCIEEECYRAELITLEQLHDLANDMPECDYKEYLLKIEEE